MTTITLIAALDENRAIGRGNTLPWRLPEDLKRFKALTVGKPVLMGRKTAQSLGRALPKRLNLVLTRSDQVPFEGMVAVASLQEALGYVDEQAELMVIGGGDIYALTLPHAHKLHLTEVHTSTVGADAFFPEMEMDHWQEVSREDHLDVPGHDHSFSFVDYVRNPQDLLVTL